MLKMLRQMFEKGLTSEKLTIKQLCAIFGNKILAVFTKKQFRRLNE
ncbi:hypothetical protein SC09_Contig24orf00139 [Bacillus subtilis]|uniref:Uncharacterized protein n=1 Tax=Bacillus subtilis TaxID=1423 RepID=A0A0D1L665_BACIU|nr:hypothetical protein SC09_Contig24orf00139 [Bacillus subtilis]